MPEVEIELLLNQVIKISQDAGNRILEVYNSEFEVEYKDNNSPLTKADRIAHEYIVCALKGLKEVLPVLSEEGAHIPFAERSEWNRYWLVDPLDGTKEFVEHNGEFTVNIALIENHQPVLGVVYAPVLKRTYYAAIDVGAYRQDRGQAARRINVRPYKEGSKWHVVASRSHMSDETADIISKLGNVEFLSMGSSLKICLIAEGKAHLYPRFGLTSEWDTAAAQCVIEQAGGVVVTPEFEPLTYNLKDSLLNPYFIAGYDVDDAWSNTITK